jgi:hypothetical protein
MIFDELDLNNSFPLLVGLDDNERPIEFGPAVARAGVVRRPTTPIAAGAAAAAPTSAATAIDLARSTGKSRHHVDEPAITLRSARSARPYDTKAFAVDTEKHLLFDVDFGDQNPADGHAVQPRAIF